MVVTGLGSWPGQDLAEAARQVAEAFGGYPFLPELPGRGAGADMIGRALGLIDALGFEWTPTGWSSADRSGGDQRRAAALLRDDLDQVAEQFEGYTGPFHISVAGPWTLAAVVARRGGEAMVADAGASRDLGQAWVDAVAEWCGRVTRLMPGIDLTLQVDEPLLPAVRAGAVRSVSGLRHHAPVEPVEVAYSGLAERCRENGVVGTVVHSCAPGLDVLLMAEAGFGAVSVDAGTLDRLAKDRLAAHWDRGGGLWLGVVPTNRPGDPVPSLDDQLGPTLRLLDELAIDPTDDRLTLTPACGLAGFTLPSALAVGRVLRQLANALAEERA